MVINLPTEEELRVATQLLDSIGGRWRSATDPARVIFAFKDRLVDLFIELHRPYSHFPTLVSHTIEFELLSSHRQTTLLGRSEAGFKEEILYSMSALREAVRTRETARGAVEALCIGGAILKLPKSDVHDIIGPDSELRIVKLWRKVLKIPLRHLGAYQLSPRFSISSANARINEIMLS